MRHRLGTLLLVAGLGVLAWAATVDLWKDPFTTAHTAYEQWRLERSLNRKFEQWAPAREPTAHAKPVDTSRQARRFRLESKDANAIARLAVRALP